MSGIFGVKLVNTLTSNDPHLDHILECQLDIKHMSDKLSEKGLWYFNIFMVMLSKKVTITAPCTGCTE